MKKATVSLLMSSVLLIQPMLSSLAYAQSADSSSKVVCEVSGQLQKRLQTEAQIEAQKITEIKEVLAGLSKEVKKDQTKDQIKDTYRIVNITLAAISAIFGNGSVGEVVDATTGAAVNKVEDVIDFKNLEKARLNVEAGLARRTEQLTSIEAAIKNISGVNCEEQAQLMSTVLQSVVTTRISELTKTIQVLEALKANAPDVSLLSKSGIYAKRFGIWNGTVLTVVGIGLIGMSTLFLKGKHPMGYLLLALGAIAGVSGGVQLYTSAVEANREINNRKQEINLIQTELSSRVSQLEAVKAYTAQVKANLN